MAELEEENHRPLRRDNTKWQSAADFLATVRDKQWNRGKGLGGGNKLSDAELGPIERALQDPHNIRAVADYLDDTSSVARKLFDYFGEMCRRNEAIVPSDISKNVYFILAVELVANMEELSSPSLKLIATTAQHGVLGLSKKAEFSAAFADTPSIFSRAAVNYPSDPEKFLTGVITKLDELERDERFASMRDTSGIFKMAAVRHPSDPEKFLTSVITKVRELEQDERFVSLKATRGIFRTAAINYPSDPEKFLTGLITKVRELERDERFTSLRNTPSVFKTAAVSYPSDPESFLVEAMARKRISKASEVSRGI